MLEPQRYGSWRKGKYKILIPRESWLILSLQGTWAGVEKHPSLTSMETPIPFYPKQLPQSTLHSMDINWRECRAKFFTSFQPWCQNWTCSCPADTSKWLGQVAFGSTQQRQQGAVSGTGGEPRARTGNHMEYVVSSGQADHRINNNIR